MFKIYRFTIENYLKRAFYFIFKYNTKKGSNFRSKRNQTFVACYFRTFIIRLVHNFYNLNKKISIFLHLV